MKIAEKKFVAIKYRLALEDGQEVDSSPEGRPLGFITGAGQIIPGLENALTGKALGENAKVTVEPEDAYGPVDHDLIRDIPKDRFPEDPAIAPGSVFQAQGPRGPIMLTVVKVNDDTLTVDMNHPLAGKRLFFDVDIVEVREPNAEEIASLSGGGGGCACGPSEQDACGCSGSGSSGASGCGSGCSCG